MISIVVPMAGLGSRFAVTGQLVPKPLIEVEPNRPMIRYVIDCLSLKEPHRLIFICQSEHDRLHAIGSSLRNMAPGCEIIFTGLLTRGPAASALLAAPVIDGDDELLVAYCDSFLTLELDEFLAYNRRRLADGGLMTYPSIDAFNSFAIVDEDGHVIRTAEKEVISTNATAGFYYFRRAQDYVESAEAMIEADRSDTTEFFVCPVFNVMIRHGKMISAYPISPDQQIEMGTPEDLRLTRAWLRAKAAAASGRGMGLANALDGQTVPDA